MKSFIITTRTITQTNYREINKGNEKSTRRRRKHCALAVVRRSQKFRPVKDPFSGAWDGQTNKHTHKETGAITIHCAAASLARSVKT